VHSVDQTNNICNIVLHGNLLLTELFIKYKYDSA
jgi:hypothetical protein